MPAPTKAPTPIRPRHPIYVISKGRADACLTSQFLRRDGVPHRVVVEPQERAAYAATVGEERLIVTPFSNLGLGGIPVRNFVWEHARAAGHARHWILDDNIRMVYYARGGRRRPMVAGPPMACLEDFADQYENAAIVGMNYTMFVVRPTKPFVLNHHVYSFLLIDCALPFRWRGRYNEDTDLCLQALSAGYCTVQSSIFSCQKVKTMTMRGGNTDQLYQGDGRLVMARSLERQWPGVVEVRRRWGRPQHVVRWSKFDVPLRPRKDAPPRREYRFEERPARPGDY